MLYITLEITEDAAKQALRNLQDKMMEILKEYINNADWDEDFKEAALKDLEDEEMDFEENWEDILIDLEMQEWPGEFELELPLMPLELTKEGKKWKLDVTAIFDSMLSSEYDDF